MIARKYLACFKTWVPGGCDTPWIRRPRF